MKIVFIYVDKKEKNILKVFVNSGFECIEELWGRKRGRHYIDGRSTT
jgi:hypothetical protein